MNETELKENNFQNLIKWQQQLIAMEENCCGPQPQAALTIDELFEFFEKHFDSYRDSANLKAILPIVHTSVRLYARRDFATHDIGLILLGFYESHHDEEEDLLIFVQILHQVLHSLGMYYHKEVVFSQKVFQQLIKQLPTLSGRVIVSNIIACFVLFKKHFSDMDFTQILWNDLSEQLKMSQVANKTHIDILVQLFDEFYSSHPNIYNDPTLVATIQFLLKSNDRDERKCGYFLLKKLMLCLIDSLKKISTIFLSEHHVTTLQRVWSFYITILENLEENQSHLILPSLENLSVIIKSKQLESEWLEILFFRILSHNNILVLRWTIEFFLENYTCSMLSVNTLKHLLNTLNTTVLYNYEGYFLEKKYFQSFLKGDLCNLYKQMSEINWRPVPLYNLLINLKNCPQPQCLPFKEVLKLSSRVRNLTDKYIRERSSFELNSHFQAVVEKMTIEQYVNYVETLFTPGDNCDVLTTLYKKRPQFDETNHQSIFQKRFFEIAQGEVNISIGELLTFLEQIPLKCHGWLRFLPFYQKPSIQNLVDRLYSLYGINMDPKEEKPIPPQNIERFKNFQNINPSKEELEQVNVLLTVINIYKLDTLDGLGEDRLSEILLHSLPKYAFKHLLKCLDKTTEVLKCLIVNRLIELLPENFYFVSSYSILIIYLEKNNLLAEYFEKLLEKQIPVNRNVLEYLSSTYIFNSDIKKGDLRIEECYKCNIDSKYTCPLYNKTYFWAHQVELYGDFKYIEYLLDLHKDVSKRKQRYFANSYEHRVKMRISWGLATLLNEVKCNSDLCDELWSILLNENNQLNITYFFEFVLSLRENRWIILLLKLEEAHNLTPSQQISIMSVVYNICMRNSPEHSYVTEHQSAIVKHFLALTMGAHFNTRLFAQMALIKLFKNKKLSGVPHVEQVINSIETATNQKVNEEYLDFRLNMYSFCSDYVKVWHYILYVTNAPYDEFEMCYLYSCDPKNELKKYRDIFCKKLETSKKNCDAASIIEPCFNQLQRKMNPSTDIVEPSNLFVYPLADASTEMFVIASLIDKLPNLGGIARTCEVLGIRNIVLNSKSDIEKSDFKNLSMTAEKSLNVIEVKQRDLSNFIINKRKEGFSVVGAEQTSTSLCFVDFKFPPKCILLLGHEKDGIPATLLGHLDFAVEIPQFGQVRSLNVHVTGALFMWEFCKQHLIQ